MTSVEIGSEQIELVESQSVASSFSSECISIQTIDSTLKEDLYAEVIFNLHYFNIIIILWLITESRTRVERSSIKY